MRNPEKFVEGDIFIHGPTGRVMRAEYYDPKTKHVTVANGAVIPESTLLEIEEPGYLREVLAEIDMLRRELRGSVATSVTINGFQFLCSTDLARQVEGLIAEHARNNGNIKSLLHRIEGYARDIDKARSTNAVQLERLGRLRGIIDGAVFALKQDNSAGALAVLESGSTI